ncbi:unnamed protein product [Calypogeia fissa]
MVALKNFQNPAQVEKSTNSKVPIIDFSGLSDSTKRASVCAQVARACETVGFFEIINSGVPQQVLDEAFDINRDFFSLPMEEKLALHPDLKDKKPLVPVFQLGYKHFPILGGVENRMEELVVRSYHMRDGPDEVYYTNGSTGDIDPTLNWWTSNPHDYKQKVERLLNELGKVGDTLLDVFSQSLGLPHTYLREVHHKNATVPRYLNFHHYPKATKSDVDETGIVPHRDSSVFTIVSQGYDTEGLQINPCGEWVPVLPKRGSLVVNVGDILQAWTNGRYRSILHRVISNRKSSRHSCAYFLFPAPGPEADYIVEPISKLISKNNPPAYVPFSYLDFFKNKMHVNSVSMLKTHEVSD